MDYEDDRGDFHQVKVTLASLRRYLGDFIKLSVDDRDASALEPAPSWQALVPRSRVLALTWAPQIPQDIADFSGTKDWDHYKAVYLGQGVYPQSPAFSQGCLHGTHKVNAINTLRRVWPMVGRQYHDTSIHMLWKLKQGSESLVALLMPISVRAKDIVGSITTQVPSSFVLDEQMRYKHGIVFYALPRIRETCVTMSTHGAGMNEGDEARLYTASSVQTALRHHTAARITFNLSRRRRRKANNVI